MSAYALTNSFIKFAREYNLSLKEAQKLVSVLKNDTYEPITQPQLTPAQAAAKCAHVLHLDNESSEKEYSHCRALMDFIHLTRISGITIETAKQHVCSLTSGDEEEYWERVFGG